MNKYIIKILPWTVCISASLFLFYEFIQGNMFASIADYIMYDFHIPANKMAYLSSIHYLANVLFLFVAGIILDKFSTKKIILFAMSLCIISTFILSQAHSFYLALICRFITGIGRAFCFLGPVRLASRWFPAKSMAMVTGIIVTIAMTGGMIAQYPMTKLVSQIGWRGALVQVSILGVIMLAIMAIGIIDKESTNNFIKKITIKKIYLNPQIIYAAAYTSLMNMGIAVFGALIGSLYLMQRLNITKETAAMINSLLFIGAIVGGPIIGWLSDKLKLRILPMKTASVCSLITILYILYGSSSIFIMKILFFLFGFFTAAQIISYALVAESNPLNITGSAVSMISILTQSGYIIYQNIFSWLLTIHNQNYVSNIIPTYDLSDYNYAAIILPIGMFIACLITFMLNETHGRHE